MIQMLTTVMQLFNGSYFSVAAGSRHLWPNSVIANSTTYVNYVSPASKWSTKIIFSKVYKWNINNWYLDIDFNLPPRHQVGQFLLFFHLQTPPVLSFALVGANMLVAILPVLVP